MAPWTCPNTKCIYDKQLDPNQPCPSCGTEAKEFSLEALSELWKQKWDLKKSLKKASDEKKLIDTMKFCPKCGSDDVDFSAFYKPSIWRCHHCGYEGPVVLEDGNVAKEISKKYRMARRKGNNR